MISARSSLQRTIGILLLMAYVLLMGEEALHRHEFVHAADPIVADGASHIAHGIIGEHSPECLLCQSIHSQVRPDDVRIPGTLPTTAPLLQSVLQPPPLAFLLVVSLRGPPTV